MRVSMIMRDESIVLMQEHKHDEVKATCGIIMLMTI